MKILECIQSDNTGTAQILFFVTQIIKLFYAVHNCVLLIHDNIAKLG